MTRALRVLAVVMILVPSGLWACGACMDLPQDDLSAWWTRLKADGYFPAGDPGFMGEAAAPDPAAHVELIFAPGSDLGVACLVHGAHAWPRSTEAEALRVAGASVPDQLAAAGVAEARVAKARRLEVRPELGPVDRWLADQDRLACFKLQKLVAGAVEMCNL